MSMEGISVFTNANWLGGRPADLYELAAYLPAPDTATWMETAGLAPGDRLLYVGAATGRHAIQFARCGLDVTCVEPDARSVAVMRQRLERDDEIADAVSRIEVHQACIEDLDGDEDCDAAVLPELVLNIASGLDEQTARLAACRRFVRPGGAIIAEVANPFALWPTISQPALPAPVSVGGEPAWITQSLHLWSFEPACQTAELAAAYHVAYLDGATQTFIEPHRLRWATPDELRIAAAQAGLEMVAGEFGAAQFMWRVIFRRPDSGT